MTSSPADRPTSRADAYLLGAVAIGLTVVVSAAGGLGWPTPARTSSGWQVADVPPGLLVLLLAVGLACPALAAVLARPWTWRAPRAAAVWWVLVLLSVFAGVWNDLYYAALSGEPGPVIPVFDWLFTSVPALVAALLTRSRGRALQLRAALGTAVVSLPLLALGAALYSAPNGLAEALGAGLSSAAFFGVVPLVVVLALTAGTDPRTPVG